MHHPHTMLTLALLLALTCTRGLALAGEEAAYSVVESDGSFEIRDYAPQVLAETLVDASLEDAGGKAFRKLFRYIGGKNAKPANTDAAAQPTSEKIPMTSPVGQVATGALWAVSFMMPSGSTLETLPTPTDPTITLRAVPACRMAAVRYSGTWSEAGYRRHLQALTAWMQARGLTPNGPPVWARYNPPVTPWFMRRNEILIPLADASGGPGPAIAIGK